MSAHVTVRCDRMGQYGGCPAQLFTTTSDLDEAYEIAAGLGWSVGGTPDLCPICAGPRRLPSVPVIPLHSRPRTGDR
ncbi:MULTISPECIES: hypothetical protein [unclassified Streptomyces]|uniref:hypothetical protein n=1 Tax=unclassified Streptomyces TaxID=2593676 RepID=UPI00226D68E0|nr:MULTISPECIES: hypothetical protein [unclassified Streptomyces]MCY0921863.1 hypothetical protein [Streptomyces sp. H27-G5]MCY0957187.1 hypothetical protein [Streptomyces sp. H27-H5]